MASLWLSIYFSHLLRQLSYVSKFERIFDSDAIEPICYGSYYYQSLVFGQSAQSLTPEISKPQVPASPSRRMPLEMPCEAHSRQRMQMSYCMALLMSSHEPYVGLYVSRPEW